jgi:hypothetical protein
MRLALDALMTDLIFVLRPVSHNGFMPEIAAAAAVVPSTGSSLPTDEAESKNL